MNSLEGEAVYTTVYTTTEEGYMKLGGDSQLISYEPPPQRSVLSRQIAI